EETCVSRDAAHRVRVLVVDLAAQDALAPRAALRRRDRVGDRLDALDADLRHVDERRRAQTERLEDARAAEAVERLAGARLHPLAQHHEAEVAVDRTRARRRLELLAVYLLEDPLLRLAARDEVRPPALLQRRDLLVVRPVRGEARRVREQVTEGHVRL